MKKTSLCLAALMAVLSLSACSDTTKNGKLFAENDLINTSTEYSKSDVASSVKQVDESMADNNIIFRNSNVVVTKLEPLATPNIVCNIWDMPTETDLYNDCDVIADVTITSLEEVAITYTFMGTECTSYETLATVSVNNIYYSTDESVSQEITIAIPNTSYFFDEDFPETTIGERCILFFSDTNRLNDSLELYNYADYYLSSPAHIININGSECKANKVFASYSSNAVSVQSVIDISDDLHGEEKLITYDGDGIVATEQFTMPFEDFENMLKAKINEKLGVNEYEN